MPASLEAENEILHQDNDALVTPSWLTLGGSSYAIRTIVRLDYRACKPPTSLATAVFCCSLILILVCLWYLFRDILPALLAWALLIASTTLMLYSAWYAFATKPYYQVWIKLLSGPPVLVQRSSRKDAEGLHKGLTEAMSWHLSSDLLINADQTQNDYPTGEWSSGMQSKRVSAVVSKTAVGARANQLIPFLSILHQKRRD